MFGRGKPSVTRSSIQTQAEQIGLLTAAKTSAEKLSELLHFLSQEQNIELRTKAKREAITSFLLEAGGSENEEILKELTASKEIFLNCGFTINWQWAVTRNMEMSTSSLSLRHGLMRAVLLLQVFTDEVPRDLIDFLIHFCLWNRQIPANERHRVAVKAAALRARPGLRVPEREQFRRQVCEHVNRDFEYALEVFRAR